MSKRNTWKLCCGLWRSLRSDKDEDHLDFLFYAQRISVYNLNCPDKLEVGEFFRARALPFIGIDYSSHLITSLNLPTRLLKFKVKIRI